MGMRPSDRSTRGNAAWRVALPEILERPEQAACIAQWVLRLGRVWFFAAVVHRRAIAGAWPAAEVGVKGVSHELLVHRLREVLSQAEPPFAFGPLVTRLGLRDLDDVQAEVVLAGAVDALLRGEVDPYSPPGDWLEWFAKNEGVDVAHRRAGGAR